MALAAAYLSVTGARAGSIFDDDWKPPVHRVEPRQELPPEKEPTPPPATQSVGRPTPPPKNVTVPKPPASQPGTPGSPVYASLPPEVDRARSRKLLKEAFAKRLKDTSPAARREIAGVLMEQARTSTGNAADQYVLATAAIDAAEQGVSLPIAFKAVDLLTSLFDVDALAAKNVAIQAVMAAPQPWSDDGSNVRLAMEVEEEFVRTNNFVDARHVLAAILRHASSNEDRALSARAQLAMRELDASQAAWDALRPMLDRLKTAPADPKANFAVGAYLCFIQEQWDRGLPYLIRGDDAAARAAAVAEKGLTAGGDAMAIAAAADAWWDFGSAQPPARRQHICRHAATLYARAEPNLTGLRLSVAKTRLGLVEAMVRPAVASGAFAVPSNESWTPVDFTVEAGKCYEIRATGTWRGSIGPTCGPEGLCPPPSFEILARSRR